MAIICKCLPFNRRASGEEAVFCAALSTMSKTLPSAPRAPLGVMFMLGSLLKLSRTLRPRPPPW